jgi:hypothetical protein
MNLLKLSHFGRGKDVGNCVKFLLERVHGGILWMDRLVHIDVHLIEKISTSGVKLGFPTQWDDKTRGLLGEQNKGQGDCRRG